MSYTKSSRTRTCLNISGLAVLSMIVQPMGVADTPQEQKTQTKTSRVIANTTADYQAISQKIKQLVQSRKLKELTAYVEDLETNWKPKAHPDDYYSVLADLARMLTSYDFKDEAQYKLAGRYAAQVLLAENNAPLAVRLSATVRVLNPKVYAAVPAELGDKVLKNLPHGFLPDRRIALSLVVLQELDAQVISEFDINKPPSRFAPVPPGSNLLPGTSPNAVTDPVQRAEYEAAIQELRKKREAHNLQWYLRQLDAEFGTVLEKSSSYLAVKQSMDEAKFKQVLEHFKIASPRKERLLLGFKSVQ